MAMLVSRSRSTCFHRYWLVNLACCKRFHVCRQSSQKRKWTKEEISLLQAWKYETNVVYGPLVDLKQAGETVSRAKYKAKLPISGDDLKLNNSQAVVGFTANVLKDSESHMANLPCSVSRHISSEHAAEELMSPPVITSFNSDNRSVKVKVDASSRTKDDDVVFDSMNRDGTFSYTWVNAQQATVEKRSREENTVASFTQTANINGDNVKQNTEKVSRHVDDMHGVSDTKRGQLSEKNSELQTDKYKTDRSDTCQKVYQSSENSTELQTDSSDNDRSLLSFPLFESPVLPAEPARLSSRFPSVSAILKATMPPESQLALSRWEQRMIAELGEDGFKEYQTGR